MRQFAVAAAFCVAATLGYRIGELTTGQASALWPAIGVGAVAILLGGRRFVIAIFVGGLGAALVQGLSLDEAVANAAVSSINPLLIAELMRRGGFDPAKGRLRDAVVLIGATTMVTPVGATLGTATIAIFRDQHSSLGLVWLTWWTGDFAGALLAIPVLLALCGPGRRRGLWRPTGPRAALAAVQLIAAVGVSIAVFTNRAPLAFLVLPVVLWIAIAGEVALVAAANAIVAGVAIIATIGGHGSFAAEELTPSLIYLYTFTACMVAGSLLLCAAAHELASARRAAEDRARFEADFLANISHELRTPLYGLRGAAGLLVATELDERQRDLVDAIGLAGGHMAHIVDDVLDVAKIEASGIQLETIEFAPATLVADCLAIVSPQAATLDVELRSALDPATPAVVTGDPARLRQILLNLLTNAIKFSPRRAAVDLTVAPDPNGRLSFGVRDRGPGIAASQLEELFNRFKQADPSISRRHGGTGLGLVIARSLVTLMNGEMTVATEVDVGTTFAFTIPAPPAAGGVRPGDHAPAIQAATALPAGDAPAAQQASGVARAVADDRAVALIVDDHPVNRLVAAMQLDALGVRVETATNGEEALELFEPGRHALVLTDLEMPRMDGYELVAAIRSREDGTGVRTPVLAFTAAVIENVEIRLRAAGFDAIVDKGGEFAGAIERWLPD